jgi:hypothetical protein
VEVREARYTGIAATEVDIPMVVGPRWPDVAFRSGIGRYMFLLSEAHIMATANTDPRITRVAQEARCSRLLFDPVVGPRQMHGGG